MAMTADQVVTLNGVSFLPQEMTISYNGVDYDSGRTADGTMSRNMLGDKRKVEFTLPPLHTADAYPIINAISGAENASFTASFPDLWSNGGYYTGTFYVGDRSAPVYSTGLDLWSNITFNIVEY